MSIASGGRVGPTRSAMPSVLSRLKIMANCGHSNALSAAASSGKGRRDLTTPKLSLMWWQIILVIRSNADRSVRNIRHRNHARIREAVHNMAVVPAHISQPAAIAKAATNGLSSAAPKVISAVSVRVDLIFHQLLKPGVLCAGFAATTVAAVTGGFHMVRRLCRDFLPVVNCAHAYPFWFVR